MRIQNSGCVVGRRRRAGRRETAKGPRQLAKEIRCGLGELGEFSEKSRDEIGGVLFCFQGDRHYWP